MLNSLHSTVFSEHNNWGWGFERAKAWCNFSSLHSNIAKVHLAKLNRPPNTDPSTADFSYVKPTSAHSSMCYVCHRNSPIDHRWTTVGSPTSVICWCMYQSHLADFACLSIEHSAVCVQLQGPMDHSAVCCQLTYIMQPSLSCRTMPRSYRR